MPAATRRLPPLKSPALDDMSDAAKAMRNRIEAPAPSASRKFWPGSASFSRPA